MTASQLDGLKASFNEVNEVIEVLNHFKWDAELAATYVSVDWLTTENNSDEEFRLTSVQQNYLLQVLNEKLNLISEKNLSDEEKVVAIREYISQAVDYNESQKNKLQNAIDTYFPK